MLSLTTVDNKYYHVYGTNMQVKLRGFRVELEHVEAVLCRCVLVDAALVAKRTSPDRLVAFVRLCLSERAWQEGGEVALRLHCREQGLLEHEVRESEHQSPSIICEKYENKMRFNAHSAPFQVVLLPTVL